MALLIAILMTLLTLGLVIWPLLTHASLPKRARRRVLALVVPLLLLAWPVYLWLGAPQLAVFTY